jgi:hypothetical protein
MIHRCLALPLNYDHPQTGQVDALRALVPEVAVLDYLAEPDPQRANERLLAMVRAAPPDLVWCQLQDTNVITAASLAQIQREHPGTSIVHWTGDARPNVSPYLASICQATDITYVSSVGALPMYRAAGARRAEYLQIGLDWDEDVLGIPAWEPPFRVPDVVFCGNYYGRAFPGTELRLAAVLRLRAEGLDVGVVGGGWPGNAPVVGSCGVKQQHHVYRRAKVALSVNHYQDIERYYSDRQIICMASGTATVCAYIPGLEAEFTDMVHCSWFHHLDDLVARVHALLDDADLRARIGAAGRERVMAEHSWTRRMEQVLRDVAVPP